MIPGLELKGFVLGLELKRLVLSKIKGLELGTYLKVSDGKPLGRHLRICFIELKEYLKPSVIHKLIFEKH